MNVITVAGNLTKDAELKYLPNGDAVANFGIADNQGKDKPAIFWNCSMFGKRAEAVAKYIIKGQPITVTGNVSEREWNDKDGSPRKSQDIRVSDVALQGGKRQDDGQAQAPRRNATASQPNVPATNFSDMDDDIPF